ncbi:MAG: hypothetical protein ABIP03_00290 [Aquihabitans sp.]
MSFRDRFFSPSVAHALTSPSGILSLGAGAAIGIVVTAPVSVPLAVVGAVVGGALGLGARLAAALPKDAETDRIDPFAVDEPWRHAIMDAIRARSRFDKAVKTFRAGPLRDSMASVSGRLEDAVNECWRVARQGQIVAEARKGINDREVTWELEQARVALGPTGANEVQARRINSLEAQVATAGRMDNLISSTKDQLDLLNARLDESVTRAIELSVSNQMSGAGSLGDDVGDIVDDLTALRLAIEDVDRSTPAPAPPPTSATPAPPPPVPQAGADSRPSAEPGT